MYFIVIRNIFYFNLFVANGKLLVVFYLKNLKITRNVAPFGNDDTLSLVFEWNRG